MKLGEHADPDEGGPWPLSRADRELARPAGRVCQRCRMELPTRVKGRFCDECVDELGPNVDHTED